MADVRFRYLDRARASASISARGIRLRADGSPECYESGAWVTVEDALLFDETNDSGLLAPFLEVTDPGTPIYATLGDKAVLPARLAGSAISTAEVYTFHRGPEGVALTEGSTGKEIALSDGAHWRVTNNASRHIGSLSETIEFALLERLDLRPAGPITGTLSRPSGLATGAARLAR
jgi:hypothetical protein